MKQVEEKAAPVPRKGRMLWNLTGLAIAFIAVAATIGLWIGTKQFADLVRGRIVAQLEKATGGRVEMRQFHWSVSNLEAAADGLVIHGTEDAGEAPYLQVDRLRVAISVIGLLDPRVHLRDLDVIRPRFHLILYPNGSTNQPHPQQPSRSRQPLQTLFNLKAGHVAVEQGLADIDARASSFDVQNRFLPLDFSAQDASLLLKYVAPAGTAPESYHIELGVRDLNLVRTSAPSQTSSTEHAAAPVPAVHGFVQASLDLTRDAVYLRSLRLTASTRGAKDRMLSVSGRLYDFAHARWQATADGDLDLRLLNPVLGYPFAPEGLARLNVRGAGDTGEFRLDGTVHIEGGAYVGPGVNARNLRLDSTVHADPSELRVSGIDVRFAQGGRMEGDLTLDHWLPHLPGQATLGAAEPATAPKPSSPGRRFWKRRKAMAAPPAPAPPPASRWTLVKPPRQEITVNGRINAKMDDLPLDTVLDVVGQEPFKRIGVNARLNGETKADWKNGDVNTLIVSGLLNISPAPQGVANEAPASGVIDGTYTQKNGAVDVRRVELKLPASEVQAHGTLGAYPLTSPSNLSVDLESRNLGEFDTVLRDLGLTREGKSGSAALPVALTGQAWFHGNWGGSLLSPRLVGEAKATQLALEIPGAPGSSQWVRWDTAEATGSYMAERIAVVQSHFTRGASRLDLEGTLEETSAPSTNLPGHHRAPVVPGAEMPGFDENSRIHARIQATHVGTDQLMPVLGLNIPVSGTVDAQLDTEGTLRALGANGWVELNDAVVYGQPVSRIRAQGTVANRLVKLSSVTATSKAGTISGSGSYDLQSRNFQGEAHGEEIDVSKIDLLHRGGQVPGGTLDFRFTGSGTPAEPRLDGHATLAKFSIGSEPLGALDLTAHTVGRDLVYKIGSRLKAAEFQVNAQTALHDDYATQGKLEFSQFNIGALLSMAHVEGISGESALAGSATFQGPLARPEQIQGEARLQVMEVTIEGVHLASEGGVHARLANARVTLDPVHIVGDQTDLHAQGTISLTDKQQLDFAASGSVNLRLAESLDPDLTAGGTTTFQVEAHGPIANPGLRGRILFENGSLSLEDVPNGLSQLHGTLEFNQNRLEIRSLTAMTGGGQLSVGGYLAYQHGLYADLTVSGKSIRIRYPQGVSSLADATLHLQGTQPNLLLSGNILLTRFSVSSDLDIAALAAQANAVSPVAPPNAPSNHIRLDVRVQSSPQLNFQNAYAKLAGDVDLRVRGTVASPSLLGRISITEGNATIAGTRYELQRGDIQFTNPVRIQPSIDLNATARVEDYDITLGLHGTPDKLSVTYRSDPPLPEADVVALLALGRTQSEQGLYTQQQVQSAGINPSTDVLLGGALNATVSSRVQKLFGAGAVKVDPSYIGALGNSTTRITVDEQLGKNVTLTYATNVDTSAQQLLQAEVAINRHVSVLVTRDESGVFSMVLKAIRRYR